MAGTLDFTTYYNERERRRQEWEAQQKENERLALEKQQLDKLGQAGVDKYAWTRQTKPVPGKPTEIQRNTRQGANPVTQMITSLLSSANGAAQPRTPVQAAAIENTQLKKLESGETNIPLAQPDNNASLKNRIQYLFNTITQCWNSAGANDPNAPIWKNDAAAKQGESALTEIRNLWSAAHKVPANARDSAAVSNVLAAMYICNFVLSGSYPWLADDQIPLFEREVANWDGIGSRTMLNNMIGHYEVILRDNDINKLPNTNQQGN